MSYAKALTAREMKVASSTYAPKGEELIQNRAAVSEPLAALLQRKDLWLGEQWQAPTSAYSSGFTLLDSHLADNGWPQQGVCECLYDGNGQGELTLVLPLLKQLIGVSGSFLTSPALADANLQVQDDSEQVGQSESIESDALVMLVAPPHIPYPHALEQQGIAVERLVWIDTPDRKEQLWAIEQALSSGSVPLVLAWLDGLSVTESRRLQLAAEKGQALCILYLPSKLADNGHPVSLRLSLKREFFDVKQPQNYLSQKHYSHKNDLRKHDLHTHSSHKLSSYQSSPKRACGDTEINIIKRRGGWPSTEFNLSLLPEHLKESLLGTSHFLIRENAINSTLGLAETSELAIAPRERGNLTLVASDSKANWHNSSNPSHSSISNRSNITNGFSKQCRLAPYSVLV
ncbi:hypothetical protein TUM4438_16510 [Shewanella sairae]|uniref:Translesion DNA synthesis-associated protein ImuA n=1 Tax=Shewanella sairae TaxID=190310 RepID=A0ABQ4PBB8_9GAMM|nr:hypothetical protein [Shewanella sairae]MCL1130190.1 hypothetical protein [Shewanella sairae]GIU44702.1 hypothetical protein TUM4438_16510 [Shewanella sairae]